MQTVILADGDFPQSDRCLKILQSAARVVCCDGSAAHLARWGREPDWIVGDLDTLSGNWQKQFADRLIHIGEQDTNDLSKAFRFCLSHNWHNLIILGATGRREDHTLGNIALLAHFAGCPGVSITMCSDFGEFFVMNRSGMIESFAGEQFSFFVLDNETFLTSQGLKYPMNHFCPQFWWQATLNEAESVSFSLHFTENKQVIVYRAFA